MTPQECWGCRCGVSCPKGKRGHEGGSHPIGPTSLEKEEAWTGRPQGCAGSQTSTGGPGRTGSARAQEPGLGRQPVAGAGRAARSPGRGGASAAGAPRSAPLSPRAAGTAGYSEASPGLQATGTGGQSGGAGLGPGAGTGPHPAWRTCVHRGPRPLLRVGPTAHAHWPCGPGGSAPRGARGLARVTPLTRTALSPGHCSCFPAAA